MHLSLAEAPRNLLVPVLRELNSFRILLWELLAKTNIISVFTRSPDTCLREWRRVVPVRKGPRTLRRLLSHTPVVLESVSVRALADFFINDGASAWLQLLVVTAGSHWEVPGLRTLHYLRPR
jgi:hypothetical protein